MRFPFLLPFILSLLKKFYILLDKLSGLGITPSLREGISDGSFTLSISFICLSKYADLACPLEVGSNISLTWGEVADIVDIYKDWVTGVYLARGVTILVVPG